MGNNSSSSGLGVAMTGVTTRATSFIKGDGESSSRVQTTEEPHTKRDIEKRRRQRERE